MRNYFRTITRSILCSAILLGIANSASAEKVALKYKTYRDWDFVLPNESFLRVSGDFRFPDSSPSVFKTKQDGAALRIDRNADGDLEAVVEGIGGLVTLAGKTHDGDKFLYALRLIKTNAGWGYAASGAALGMIDGQKVRIIDQNNNGRYNDYGSDAMLIGQGRYATFLSEVINVRGKLYSVEVSADGMSLSYEPYSGERGTLDLTTQFATKGKLLSAIVRSADGKNSFDMTGGPLEIPAGPYELDHGKIGVGRNVVTFTKGDLQSITVEPGSTSSLALGGPINIKFDYVLQAGQVIMDPKLVSYVGRAGEVYASWNPFGGSPQFDVRDTSTGEQIALAVFGGT
ncbi:MAG: hypothetical protein ACI8XO_005041 [Verrucomicrobiales bacterium]|jgi:hypothetical protein